MCLVNLQLAQKNLRQATIHNRIIAWGTNRGQDIPQALSSCHEDATWIPYRVLLIFGCFPKTQTPNDCFIIHTGQKLALTKKTRQKNSIRVKQSHQKNLTVRSSKQSKTHKPVSALLQNSENFRKNIQHRAPHYSELATPAYGRYGINKLL